MRWFCGIVVLIFMALICAPRAGGQGDPVPQPGVQIVSGPMIGAVNEKSAQLWLQLSEARNVSVKCIEIGPRGKSSMVSENVEGPLPFVVAVPLPDLSPSRTY